MDILLEQLVYGSFPFWDRGYDVLARSPGCRAEWVAEVLASCRNLGEAPSGLVPAPSLFARKLKSGPWAVVGVEPQGVDDRGRPGALAFHALLVDPGDYRKAGANPFVFAPGHRRDWNAGSTLGAFFLTIETPPKTPATDPRTRRVVEALAKGRRVAIESAEPIETLAREVWPGLPASVRRRGSVATWAFGNANRFDLVGLPRLAGVELDRTYLEPGSLDQPLAETSGRSARWVVPAALSISILFLIGLGLAWWVASRPRSPWNRNDPANSDQRSDAGPSLGPGDRAKILAGLETLADRFSLGGSPAPGSVLAGLSAQFHYRGAMLSPADLARLTLETDPDRDRAIAWHERIRRTFVDDQPLPDDFARLPLDRQLELVARSFHLAPDLRPIAIPEGLLEALSREGPIRPTPLAVRYPALSEYARFLGRLPRLEK